MTQPNGKTNLSSSPVTYKGLYTSIGLFTAIMGVFMLLYTNFILPTISAMNEMTARELIKQEMLERPRHPTSVGRDEYVGFQKLIDLRLESIQKDQERMQKGLDEIKSAITELKRN